MSKNKISNDEEIRKLVIARLKLLSPNTIKCIGNEGDFSRDELIYHVSAGDKIGKIIANIEMEWLRALKEGIIPKIYA